MSGRVPAAALASIGRVTNTAESRADLDELEIDAVEQLAKGVETGEAQSPPIEPEPRVTVIRPASRRPHLDVSELWQYRELLGTLVRRDIKVRYKQTFVGFAWAFLLPIFTSAVYVIVFGKFAKFNPGSVGHYPILVLAGVLPMQYFSSALSGSSMSLVSNLPLVTKVYFPRVKLPLAAAVVPIVDLVFGLPALIILMAYYGAWPAGPEVVFAPLFIGLAFVTALGAGFLLSTLNVRYRDVPFMLPPLMQVLPLVSGVFYAIPTLPAKWQWLLAFNPMAAVITGWRWALVGADAPNPWQTLIGVSVAIGLFVVGLGVFRSNEPRIVDKI